MDWHSEFYFLLIAKIIRWLKLVFQILLQPRDTYRVFYATKPNKANYQARHEMRLSGSQFSSVNPFSVYCNFYNIHCNFYNVYCNNYHLKNLNCKNISNMPIMCVIQNTHMLIYFNVIIIFYDKHNITNNGGVS